MAQVELPATIEGLLQPEAYGHAVGDGVQLIQTHVSYVLLAGDQVYKVKKPVDFGFINYSTPARRKRASEDEVRLNRRGCPEIYLGVVPVVETNRGIRIGGDGRVLDYAVHMKRLPTGSMLNELLEAGAVTLPMLGRLAGRLAEFHQAAERSDRITRIGGAGSFGRNWRENTERNSAFAGRTISPEQLAALRSFSSSFLRDENALLRRRDAEGWVRDCHGDLRSDAVCFDDSLEGGIGFVDCIEFNDAFRYTDTGLDAGFLAMDLEFRGRPDLADAFIGLYVTAMGDRELPLLLRAYRSYRAGVRGLVESLTLDDEDVSRQQKAGARRRARAYFRLAASYAKPTPNPGIVLMMGLSGSGKSVLAGALASRLGTALLATDVVRRELDDSQGTDAPVGEGRYSDNRRNQVYEALAEQAESYVRAGRGVVLDGTYIEARQRKRIIDLAASLKAPLTVIECEAPEQVVRQRQQQRQSEAWTASEGRWEVYLAQKQQYEPPDEVPSARRLRIDTTRPLGEQIDDAASFIRRKRRKR
jgi:aminoglycoside phosphotransferase family enzyme/predicted kinase